MSGQTSNTFNKFHINLSSSGTNPAIYASFLEWEPIVLSDSSISEEHSSSAVRIPSIVSQVSGVSEVPEIQETTHQVPCGKHSIFDPDEKVPGFVRVVYLQMNEHSNWESGVTHALSLRHLAKSVNVKNHSQVHRALQWLIENGWILVKGKRKSDGAYFYQIVHHKCDPQDVPVDRDGRPQKCAVPTGPGSPSQLLAEGKITWRVFLDWTVRKIHSCWTSGIAKMAVRDTAKLAKLSVKTIAKNAKKMMEIGLLKRLSPKFRLSEYQMFPKPYTNRRERTPEPCASKKAMKCINGWYYSYNGLWRFHKQTFHIKMQEHGGRWRDSNSEELANINRSIYKDFCQYMQRLARLPKTASP
ncbi:hypothetical protein F4X73_15235 [Candidatus Poribacteria bacterium]|nr:hypothetical protein [Candidatus Poribacteria bacterium]